jgi:hypothetical protein
MKKIIRLTENDLARIIRRVIQEQTSPSQYKVGQILNNMKRSTDGEFYTIKIREVGDGYVMADIKGQGSYDSDGQYKGNPLQITNPYKLSSVKPGELSGDSEMGTFRGKQAPLNIKSTYEAIRSTDKQKYQITINSIYTDSEDDYNGYMASIVGPGTYEGNKLTAQNAAADSNGGYDLSGEETNVIGGNTEMGKFTIIRKIK